MRPLFAAVVLLLVAACGDDGGNPANPDAGAKPDAEVEGCAPGPDAAPSGVALGDVTGTWAVVEHSRAVVGQPLNSAQISRELYTFDITQTGTDLAIVEHMCDIQVDDEGGLETTRMLPSLWANLPVLNRTGKLESDGAGGFTFTLDRAYRSRGITLADVANDPLPTDPADSRIADWDMDSHPGITLLLDGIIDGQAFVIQREFNQYDAKQTGVDMIEGHTMWDSDQVYLGSDPDAIKDLNIQAEPDPDGTKHTVLLVRVPSGSDCSYVTANQCTLFAGK